MSFFLSALGLMMVFEGIPYFCFPKKVKAFAEKLPEIPDSTLRVVGFFSYDDRVVGCLYRRRKECLIV